MNRTPRRSGGFEQTLAAAPLVSVEAVELTLPVESREAVKVILKSGASANTERAYTRAMHYWSRWCQLSVGCALPFPVPPELVIQFITEHLARWDSNRKDARLLMPTMPAAVEAQLVAEGLRRAGAWKRATLDLRLAVLSQWHSTAPLQADGYRVPNPCAHPRVRELLRSAARADSKNNVRQSRKSPVLKSHLNAMLATCDASLVGDRDRALLLFGWASGGRRRSEIAGATLEQLSKPKEDLYLFRMGKTKAKQEGDDSRQPLRGTAAVALSRWLVRANIRKGPIFRRIRNGAVLDTALSGRAVAEIIQKRAAQAGLPGDWGGHSLRSGYITEGVNRNLPMFEIMAMTRQSTTSVVQRYYREGELANSRAAALLDEE